MAFPTLKPLQQTKLQLSSSHCKYSPSLNTFKFPFYTYFRPAKHTLHLQVKATVASHLETRLSKDDTTINHIVSGPKDDYNVGSFKFPTISKRVGKKNLQHGEESIERKVILRDINAKPKENLARKNAEIKIKSWKVGNEDEEKRTKKSKVDSPGLALRVGLDLCSKRGDVVGAIKLYELAMKEGIKIGLYHFGVLLYLCSSASTGVIQPARSGNRSRSLSPADSFKEISIVDSISVTKSSKIAKRSSNANSLDELVLEMKKNADFFRNKESVSSEVCEIKVSEDVQRLALQKGFEIYNKMCMEKVPMNEATLTSVARMAMALGDGDMAFDMVKQMKDFGINPRLRSYGPSLSIFCNNGDVEKAFIVEEHMLANGVYPEEPELGALLKVSIAGGESEKVYYILHKLRTSVRQVSMSTADLIEWWFKSKTASRVGKRKWDKKLITQAVENGGGGWHGKGWLGTGKWTVCRSPIGSDGFCKCCGEKLVTIDLDQEETEKFAQSVASIASEKEKHSSFEKFQKWLDYYGPFEAVVDAANVGMYSQRRFKPSKVNAVVNGIRQMIPSRKWPLVILHNRRITGDKMDEPVNKTLIEKWKNADALFATPTGSNDDWYWLYAAIKCKCLLVTNDEMRDHLFQLLGNDFFPKWKERHQVHFSFTETGPEFRMPPPCSVVIQESEKGHWHIPVVSELEREDQRIWLCCTRANSSLTRQDSANLPKVHKKNEARMDARVKKRIELKLAKLGNHDKSKQELEELDYKKALSTLENDRSILQKLERAEKLAACVIDFQI